MNQWIAPSSGGYSAKGSVPATPPVPPKYPASAAKAGEEKVKRPSAVEKAELFIEQLAAAVDESKFNCECQVGGVDAMSVDTDWMQAGVRNLIAGWTTLRQAEERD